MKRLVVDVAEWLHEKVRRYAKADNRSIQGLVRHVLVEYMQQNPKWTENGSKSIK